MKPTKRTKNYAIFHGDCVDVLGSLKPASVDVAVTDPPYGIGYKYNSYEDTRDNLKDLIAKFFPLLRSVANRVYILPGITQVSLYPEPDWIMSIVWNTTGSFGAYGFTQWMPVLCYGKDQKGFARLDNGVLKSDLISISGGSGVGFQRRKNEKEHSCPKPSNLIRLLMERLVAKNEIVIDPFMGSGTIGMVSIERGNRFIGIEQDAKYFANAEHRLSKTKYRTTLWDCVE